MNGIFPISFFSPDLLLGFYHVSDNACASLSLFFVLAMADARLILPPWSLLTRSPPPFHLFIFLFNLQPYDHRHLSTSHSIISRFDYPSRLSGPIVTITIVLLIELSSFFFFFLIFFFLSSIPSRSSQTTINAAITPFVPYFSHSHTRKMKERNYLSFLITILSIHILYCTQTCF